MDIPKLRIFATVARLGNFTRAAELLYLTQPTVSQQLATLEAQIGAPLIERLPRRQRLTPAGEALLPYAEQILALADAAAEAARAAAFHVIDSTRVLSIATNLGDTKSIVTHPATTSHGRLSEAQRQASGIGQGLIRLAVGLEHVDDITDDLQRGLGTLTT